MKRLLTAWLVAVPLLLGASGVDAAPLAARDTAHVGARGSWSVGVFNPLAIAVKDGIELQSHALTALVSPNLVVRVRHAELGGFRLTGEYGLSVPTPAMRLLQAGGPTPLSLFPAWDQSARQVGLFLVPRAGLVASRGELHEAVLTLKLDVAAGIPLTRNDAEPLIGVAPVDLLLAPALSGYRARAGVTYDRPLVDWLRGRVYADLWLHGRQPSPVTFTTGVGFDLAVGKSSRLTLGAMYWNSDTWEIDPKTHEHVRSHDFFPTIDFIWAG